MQQDYTKPVMIPTKRTEITVLRDGQEYRVPSTSGTYIDYSNEVQKTNYTRMTEPPTMMSHCIAKTTFEHLSPLPVVTQDVPLTTKPLPSLGRITYSSYNEVKHHVPSVVRSVSGMKIDTPNIYPSSCKSNSSPFSTHHISAAPVHNVGSRIVNTHQISTQRYYPPTEDTPKQPNVIYSHPAVNVSESNAAISVPTNPHLFPFSRELRATAVTEDTTPVQNFKTGDAPRIFNSDQNSLELTLQNASVVYSIDQSIPAPSTNRFYEQNVTISPQNENPEDTKEIKRNKAAEAALLRATDGYEQRSNHRVAVGVTERFNQLEADETMTNPNNGSEPHRTIIVVGNVIPVYKLNNPVKSTEPDVRTLWN